MQKTNDAFLDGLSSGTPLKLSTLKTLSMADLMGLAEKYGIENASSLRKQELSFAILQACASQNGAIYGDGVLEILPDGFGFLRSPLCSYLPGPDDIMFLPRRYANFPCAKGTLLPDKSVLRERVNAISHCSG